LGKHAVYNCKVDYKVCEQKFTQEQRIFALRSKQTDAVGDHSSSFAACEGRVDCGVCSVRQYGLWCVFCASVWTVVCVLCVSVDCGVCSVRQYGLWCVFCAPVWTVVCVLCVSMDCGVCSVRQYGLWCVFCASVWTVVCVLCVSMDCGVCSVRQYGLWCVFCAPVWTVVCVLCVSVNCGVCSVRQCFLWYVFCAPDSARLDGLFVRLRSFLSACSSSEIAQWMSINSTFLGTREISLIFGIHITSN